MLLLELAVRTTVPLEVDGILPETLRGMSLAEIERLPIQHGNRQEPLAAFFRVSGDPSDENLELGGDCSGVHWIGAKMTRGTIRVLRSAGRHLGSEMRGGEIHALGDASDWLGGEMQGGLIHVRGNAGHLVGGGYRGSRVGMTEGVILVGGSAGHEIGHTMRRGLIAIGGEAGDLAGFNMLAGTILIFGNAGSRHGSGMRRGTIGLLGPRPPTMLPSFRRAGRFRPPALDLVLRSLTERGFAVPDALRETPIELWNGDVLEGGRGEILLRAQRD